MIATAHFSKSSPAIKQSSGTKTLSSRDQKTRRSEMLRERRKQLFGRQISFIPCRQFRNANAKRLASIPPSESRTPLESFDSKTIPSGLSPYLASLYRTRLLSKDEEYFYFRRMNWLKYRANADRRRLSKTHCTLRQIESVESLLNDAETVKSIIISSNLRLVVSIAKKFVDPNTSFEELVSEGNIALMRAVEKFNFSLGNRFSTYATYAIQRHFFRVSQKARQQKSRFVPTAEVAKDRPELETGHEYCSSEQISELKEVFQSFLTDLEPREKQIVVARFGFDGKPPRTFRELGSQMGVCKERIRQIQTRAIDKLRGMAASVHLQQTVDNWL